jgi:hypothetical protein
MNAVVGRRIFVGSVAAGLPLIAGAVHGVRAQAAAGQDHDHTANGSSDAVFDQIVREMAIVHARIRSRGARGEDARAIAAQLRTAIVHTQQRGIDAPAKKALADLVRTRGRDAVLYLEIDKPNAKARLKQYGIQADDRWFDTTGVDYATRNRVLDEFLAGGLAGALARSADVFERLGAEIDRRGGEVRRASLQLDPDFLVGFCAQLQNEIFRLGMDAAFVCAASYFFPPLASVCAMIEAAIGVDSLVYIVLC